MTVTITNSVQLGDNKPLALIAGPCVIESRGLIMQTAERLVEITDKLGIPFIFKSSFKKANRTSLQSFTGLDPAEAISYLAEVRSKYQIPVVTDIHTEEDAAFAAQYVDILQIPAFLCRQTDLLLAAGRTGKVVNVKKGQFLAPEDMQHAADKVKSTGNSSVMLTERGSSFGYHNLVVDMKGLVIMRQTGCPVIMDATHAVQIPSQGGTSGGLPQFIKPLAAAATAVGIDGLFLEVHPNPSKALSDAGSQLALDGVSDLLELVRDIDRRVKNL